MSEQESDRPWNREEGRAESRLPPSSPQRQTEGGGELSGGREVKRERLDASQCQSKSLDRGCGRTGVSGVLGGAGKRGG